MASLIVLTTAIVGLVSGAAVDADAVNRLVRGVGNYVAHQPPCTKYYAPFDYRGCYDDSRLRVLPWTVMGLNGSQMTVEYCQAACKANFFKFAGVEYGNQCYCNVALSGVRRSKGQCQMPCPGDPTEDCGGISRVAVYEDKTFDTVSPGDTTGFESRGCYSDSTVKPALSIFQNYLDSTKMTVNMCLQACKSRGFPLAGLIGGDKCYCSVVLADGATPVEPETCNNPCTGDENEVCGDDEFWSLWSSDELRESRPCDSDSFPDY